jgi:acyl-[acyl-carrier-protein]-phospholipid O-acyltransferase/long-chain-fatty-acid--[acyl-carrier-protein] ligase
LSTKRFLPLFITQALTAFNGNAFRNALVILITYDLAAHSGLNAPTLVSIVAGLFILPSFLFSAVAGQFAEKFDKALLIRRIKLAELGIMLLAAVGFATDVLYWHMAVLFLLGCQSAFFGPVKYSILPQLLGEKELISGNSLVEMGTFLAILLGTLFGGLLILTETGPAVVAAVLLLFAGAGYLASRYIPPAPPVLPSMRINPSFLAETVTIIRHASSKREIFLCVLGISWFWLLGAVFLAQFPAFAQATLSANEQVGNLFIAVFSVGISIGSLLCNKLLKGRIEATYVPLGAIGISVFCVDLVLSSSSLAAGGGAVIGVGAFLAEPANWRLLGDLLAISICGGLYIVPLYAIIQVRSDADHVSRNVAANNVLNALFMVAGAGFSAVLLATGMSVPGLFIVIATANLLAAVIVCKLVPASSLSLLPHGVRRVIGKAE